MINKFVTMTHQRKLDEKEKGKENFACVYLLSVHVCRPLKYSLSVTHLIFFLSSSNWRKLIKLEFDNEKSLFSKKKNVTTQYFRILFWAIKLQTLRNSFWNEMIGSTMIFKDIWNLIIIRIRNDYSFKKNALLFFVDLGLRGLSLLFELVVIQTMFFII